MKILIALLLSVMLGKNVLATENIATWTYHDFPPFIVDEKTKSGLSYDLLALMNKAAQGKWRFTLQVLPKRRVDLKLKENEKGILIWTPDMLYGTPAGEGFIWSDYLIRDQQDFLSLNQKKLDYDGQASSLFSYKLGGILGHIYPGIQEDIDAGRIQRQDVNNEKSLVQMLRLGRFDVVCIPHSAASYFVQKMGIADQIHFSNRALIIFERKILIQNGMSKDLVEFLMQFSKTIQTDPEWKKTLTRYGL